MEPAAPSPDDTGLIPLPPQPDGVPWPTLLWPVAAPDDDAVDLDVAALELASGALFDPAQRGRLGTTHALVVVKGGRIVVERYAPGVAGTSRRISWSTAKSVLHALVGILVREGRLELDSPAAVPEWAGADDLRSAITLRQLLEFRSGLAWREEYVDDQASDVIDMLFGAGQDDMGAFAAAMPLAAEPDSTFCYSSGTSNIVSRIVAEVVGTGDDYLGFARRELFGPLGMLSAKPRFDGAGTLVASSYVYATARDFARFAHLYLRDGVWEGRRLLPEGWVDMARTPRSTDADGDRHGMHWWMWDENPWGAFAAVGYEGQYLLVAPALDAVVVRLGKTGADLRPGLRAQLSGVLASLAG